MTLTYATSFDGPLLVDCMRLFVEPECFVVQIWSCFWCERTFLLFDEEFFEDRVDTSCSICNVGSRTCRSYGHQITIADAVFCNICSQLFPTIGCVATTCEVFTSFPLGTFECRVCTFFFRQFHRSFDGIVRDVFEQLVRYFDMFIRLPLDIVVYKVVVVTRSTKTNSTVFIRSHARFWYWCLVDGNNIV